MTTIVIPCLAGNTSKSQTMAEEEINYREELQRCLAAAEGLTLDGKGGTLDLCRDICAGCVLVAEQDWQNQEKTWEIPLLAETCLKYAKHLEGFDQELDYVNNVMERMTETIPEGHPRLMLRLLQFRLLVLRRIECLTDHDLSAAEDVEKEIEYHQRNIARADRGALEEIEQKGHLKADPVQWTWQFEKVCEAAEEEVYRRLEGTPRGMGFCFAYWAEKKTVLKEIYGIDWKSPSEMNPRVLFD